MKYHGNTIFGKAIPKELKTLSVDEFLGRIYGALNNIPAREAIATSSTGFANKDDYGIVVYIKTALWFYIAEVTMGKETLDKGMKAYFETWKYKHPYPEDLRQSLEKASNTNLGSLFGLLHKEGSLR